MQRTKRRCYICRVPLVPGKTVTDKKSGLTATECRACHAERTLKSYHDRPFHCLALLKNSKTKIKTGVPGDLTAEYLAELPRPTVCPILRLTGFALDFDAPSFSPHAKELDRIIPDLWYRRGNVRWVSRRGNRLKDNGTLPEFQSVIADQLTMLTQKESNAA